MKNSCIMCFLLMAVSISCHAKERQESELRKIAANQLNKKKTEAGTRKKARTAEFVLQRTMKDGNVVVYAAEGVGSVFISTDDKFRPVLGYTAELVTENTSMPCCMKWWLREMNRQMNDNSIRTQKSDEAVMEQSVAKVHYQTVSPMVSTKWGQSAPYNSYTPKIDNKNTPTGCVATALAQILNYNEWPKSANFTGEYSTDGGKNFVKAKVNTTYNYPYKMAYGAYSVDGSSDNISTISYSIVENKHIGWLMRDCGYASKMSYGTDASGATVNNSALNAIQFFSYPEESVKFAQRYYYSDTEWHNMVYEELAKGYPILYGGSDAEAGGHAFVVHGIDSDGLVAVNWGWQGVCDGFYAMDAMNTGDEAFCDNQHIAYGFHPTPLPDDKFSSLWAGDYSLVSEDTTDKLQLGVSGIYNYTLKDFTGYLYLCFEDIAKEKNMEKIEIIVPDDGTISPFYGFEISQTDISKDVAEIVEKGHRYKVYIASCTEDEFKTDILVKARTQGGCKYYIIDVDNNGKISIIGNDFDISTSVVSVINTTQKNQKIETYTPIGRHVNNSYRGIIIRKQGNKVSKIFAR